MSSSTHGLDPRVAQCSVSVNDRAGTLRGMHLQLAPFEETKVVRCTRGAIFDVVVDLRPESPALGRWLGLELRAGDGHSVYVPAGCAHGFLVLEDVTEVEYLISAAYAPEHARGIRWDDPAIAIEWPFAPEHRLGTRSVVRERRSRRRPSVGARSAALTSDPDDGLAGVERLGQARRRVALEAAEPHQGAEGRVVEPTP